MNNHDSSETNVRAAENPAEQSPLDASEPQGPVPAPCPQGGHSPARPSTSAVGPSDEEEQPLNPYEAKQEARRGRLLGASAQAAAEAKTLSARAGAMASVIPFGQPILVGHHSEGRDRRYRARFGRLYDKSFEAQNRAADLVRRAAAVGTGSISSDDPDAIAKLREELAAVETDIARMKAVNAAHKRFVKVPASIETAPISDSDKAICRRYQPAYSWEPHPFAPYRLSNAGANARRIRKRMDELEARATTPAREAIVGEGWMITEDASDNRVSITFAAIPAAAVRERLKRSGFRWSPQRGAWVRQRNNAAWAAAIYAMGKE